jgi:hypothetical protein
MNYYMACTVSFALGALTPVVIWAAAALWRLVSSLRRELQAP